MKKTYLPYQILENIKISHKVYKMVIKFQQDVKSGQFFMLKSWQDTSPLLPRPISICDHDQDKGTVTFLYLVVGKGTQIFSRLTNMDKIELMGPLGNGFDQNLQGKIALVGGGIGIAPLYLLGKRLKSSVIDSYLGFREQPYFVEEFQNISRNIQVYTESGNYGKKGLVTQDFDEKNYDYIFSCGPNPMLEALKEKVQDKEKLYLSLEKRMACGIGACLSCAQKTKNGMKTVCKDGPIFRADEVVTC